MRLPLLPLLMLPLVLARPAAAGICWSEMESNGRCTSVSAMRVERAECCAGGARAPAAWSPRDLADHEMFFHKILSGGVPCTACAESCAGVSCGPGRRCVVRGGRARCVCASSCRRAGQVCGSDGKTYKSLCRLRRRACRKPAKHLTLDYPGPCREGSCEGVRCGGGKQCVLDAELGAHCVRCGGCTVAGAPVCAVDGRTYAGLCALRHAACLHGRALPLAYRGPCIANATCGRITCGASQRCVSGGASGARCVSCGACGGGSGGGRGGGGGGARRVLCASDARTYGSWCRLQRAACRAGTVLDPLHTGPCKGKECKKAWALLRDGFRRAIKKRKDTKSGQASVAEKKWKYEEEMSFLLPYMKERPTTCSLPTVSDCDNDDNANEEEEIAQSPEDGQQTTSIFPFTPDVSHQTAGTFLSSTDRGQQTAATLPTTSSPATTQNCPRPKRTKQGQKRTKDKPSTVLMKYIIESKKNTQPPDDIEQFMAGITTTLRSFPARDKAIAKAKIFEIVSQMEIDILSRPSTSPMVSTSSSTNYSETTPVSDTVQYFGEHYLSLNSLQMQWEQKPNNLEE